MNIYYLNHDTLEDKQMGPILLMLRLKIEGSLLYVVYVHCMLCIVDELKRFFFRFHREYRI